MSSPDNERVTMVQLRNGREGKLWRSLSASIDPDGNLKVTGHDLGPGASHVPDADEDEWWYTIRKRDLPKLVGLLGGKPGDGIIELLSEHWTGPQSHEFVRILYSSDIETVDFHSWP